MKDKLISVIVPAFNVEKYIEQCITSILSQTYRNLELLIINDGSTDQTKFICENYERKDKRLKLISVKNNGVSSARNIGLKEAKGDYIFFVDSDDWIEPETLMDMKTSLEKSEFDCVMCSYNSYKNNNKIKSNHITNNSNMVYTQKSIINAMCYMNNPYENFDLGVIWGALYKKELINKIQFNENISIGEDFEFKYKVLLNSNSVMCTETQYYNYRLHSQSAMHGAFNEKKIKSFIELEDFFNSKFVISEYKEAVRVRVTNIAIVLLLMIPFNKKYTIYRKQIQSFIKQNRRSVLKNPNARIKLKGALLLTFFGFGLMEKLFYKLKSKEMI